MPLKFCLSHHPPLKAKIKQYRKLLIKYNIKYITGNTYPFNDISPVIAIIDFKGIFQKREINAQTIVIPADGPSFGFPPAGKWT